eukprot:m.258080 g.258080  ORF g.258080 m.258080 type:complete len:92 (-) comp36063_c0_seq1:275-550(-)
MTKATEVFGVVALLLGVWGYVMFSGHVQVSDKVDEVLPFLPIWGLCCFGSYSLVEIGHKLMTFGDADVASEELKKEVIEACQDLKKKGLTL